MTETKKIVDLGARLGSDSGSAQPTTIDVPINPKETLRQIDPAPFGCAASPAPAQPAQPAQQSAAQPAPSQPTRGSRGSQNQSTLGAIENMAKWIEKWAWLIASLWGIATAVYVLSVLFPMNHALAMSSGGALALTLYLVAKDGAKHPLYLVAILTALGGHVVLFVSPLVK